MFNVWSSVFTNMMFGMANLRSALFRISFLQFSHEGGRVRHAFGFGRWINSVRPTRLVTAIETGFNSGQPWMADRGRNLHARYYYTIQKRVKRFLPFLSPMVCSAEYRLTACCLPASKLSSSCAGVEWVPICQRTVCRATRLSVNFVKVNRA